MCVRSRITRALHGGCRQYRLGQREARGGVGAASHAPLVMTLNGLAAGVLWAPTEGAFG